LLTEKEAELSFSKAKLVNLFDIISFPTGQSLI